MRAYNEFSRPWLLASGRFRAKRGMSIIELLISLAICASLLTAAAMAFNASAGAVEANDQMFRAIQTARVSVNQIMTETRRCQSGAVASTSLDLTLASGETRTYFFDSTNKLLMATLHSLPTAETHPMARNVTDVQFSTDGKTISMMITVTVGKNSVVLNGSAMPRRAVVYH